MLKVSFWNHHCLDFFLDNDLLFSLYTELFNLVHFFVSLSIFGKKKKINDNETRYLIDYSSGDECILKCKEFIGNLIVNRTIVSPSKRNTRTGLQHLGLFWALSVSCQYHIVHRTRYIIQIISPFQPCYVTQIWFVIFC